MKIQSKSTRTHTFKQPISARETALNVLEQAGKTKPVQSLLNKALLGNLLSKQDIALTTELVYGYLRSELRISWLLKQFLKKPQKLPATMQLLLGIAVYELLYLDKIPSYASVNATVTTINTYFGKTLACVTNGTLRTILRQCETSDTPKQKNFTNND